MAPAIAIYAKGKEVKFCNSFVLQQQKFWRESVSKAKKIFIVGLKVNPEDTHIWEVLKLSKAKLYYVGGDVNDFLEWKSVEGRKGTDVIAKTFEEAMPKIKKHLSSF